MSRQFDKSPITGEKSRRAGLVISGLVSRADEVEKLPFYSQPKAIRELKDATKQLLHYLHSEIIALEAELNRSRSEAGRGGESKVLIHGKEGFTWRVTL